MSTGWSWYVAILVTSNVVGAAVLLFWVRSTRAGAAPGETLGHAFDGIEEQDAPLPRWWLWLFVGTIVFTVGYLVLYPGFGAFGGTRGWTQRGQYAEEMRAAQARYGPLYARYAAEPLPAVAADPQAVAMGQRIFANTCSPCHGADARGGPGYPDLTDADWLWGGDPATIEATVLNGRGGMMPPFAPALGGPDGVRDVVAYVLSLSGRTVDPAQAAAGKQRFDTICVACHGPAGKGNPALGAPNLTDDVWLYGGTAAAITEGLEHGRMGKMPAHGETLGPEKVHLVAAYVYALSHPEAAAAAAR